jgi:archaeal type IV pilus assembly protein PilA
MKKMSTYGKGSEDAVSPVIGVILMVAITVILAAVIAAFVFGMAGNVSKTRSIAMTAQKQGNNIVVTNNGGPDNQDLSTWYLNINGQNMTVAGYYGNNTNVGYYVTVPTGTTAGQSYVKSATGKDHVLVTGVFTDNSQQVLLDTNI